jgi:Zn-dependent protease with chaperone function
MDFFAAQEEARKRTRLLVVLFGLAILGIVFLIYLPANLWFTGGRGGYDPVLFAQIALPVSLFILAGSWWRLRSLRAGGPTVATLMGGRQVLPNAHGPAERRLLNIVEEMALASGTPVPAVFVLDREEGVNAFAAGYSIHDAAVVVTRGCLERLDRDELQGVMAHEFSHILNGDMRLNIRLVGILYGLLLLTVVGRGILRGAAYSGHRRDRSGGAQAAALGLGLMAVGYVGIFFGKLIKSAISREREYLADAAAVQFTRNPGGIAGALKKIEMLYPGGVLEDHHAEELSHVFFVNGLREGWVNLFRTHPPIERRIRRIDPRWDGRYDVKVPDIMKERAEAARADRVPGEGVPAMARMGLPVAAVVASMGAPAAVHLAYARRLLDRIPDALRDAAHDAEGARALVFALLLDPEPGTVRADQLERIREYGGDAVVRAAENLADGVLASGPDARLALLDLALPALRTLPVAQATPFRRTAQHLIRADGQVRMFDYAVVHILARHLASDREPARDRSASIHSFRPIRDEVELVLSAVARSGASTDREAEAAFRAAADRLPGTVGELALRPEPAVDVVRVDRALRRLEEATLGIRRRLVDACAHCVAFDGQVLADEAEALRAIAEALDCPLPLIGTRAPSPVAA